MVRKARLAPLERKRFQRLRRRIQDNDTDLATLDVQETILEAISEVAYGATISEIRVVEVAITEAEIIGNSTGELAHVAGLILVAAPGAGYALQLISIMLIYDYDTAAYTGGDDTLRGRVGTVDATGAIAAADLITKAGDTIVQLNPLTTDFVITENATINIKIDTQVTDPGTADGVMRAKISYRVITTGL